LAYVATLLEQRRNIVRIYDLALEPETPLDVALRPLQVFQPQLVLLVGNQRAQLEEALTLLQHQPGRVVPLRMTRASLESGYALVEIVARLGLAEALATLPDSTPNVEQLPLPARHLLSLERYEKRASGGELQTSLLIGCPVHSSPSVSRLRLPGQIVAELRSVSREYGIRHYQLTGACLTTDAEWLLSLLAHLRDAELGIGWEGSVTTEGLSEDLIHHMAYAGCEALRLVLDAADVFESAQARSHVRQMVELAQRHDIQVHADLVLRPPYEAVARLVDVAATFGLDNVAFTMVSPTLAADAAPLGPDEDEGLALMARQLYHAGRARQRMIDRFGPALGSLIWRVRRSRLVSGVLSSEQHPAG
jgi:hypothetical protein